tara:strand:+ start:290 stop:508 length:219 start_codon:yes stop_codon:yes gene_type:complete
MSKENTAEDYPLNDSKFMEVDDKLYPIINSILFPNNEYTMNEFPKLFGKYCDIRNNLCEQIEELKELTRRYK